MKYRTIIADPPWKYKTGGTLKGLAADQYPTMTAEDIGRLPVPAADDSVLIEWCTWPQLNEGLHVMKSWGFSYVTGFPWIKITDINRNLFDGTYDFRPTYGVGYWARGVTEFVLIGRRGNVSPPNTNFIGLLSPNAKHSRKPDDIYHYAEALPGPRLEMFARRKRDGWDVYGNEVKNGIELPPRQ